MISRRPWIAPRDGGYHAVPPEGWDGTRPPPPRGPGAASSVRRTKTLAERYADTGESGYGSRPLPDEIVLALARGYLPKDDDVERLAAEVVRWRIAAVEETDAKA